MAGLIPFNRKRSDLMSTGFGDLQNMLDDFFAESWPFSRSLAGDTFKVDVQDNGSEYVVEAEIPGACKDEIDVSLDDGRLRIAVTKQESNEETGKNYIHRERRYSSASRNIYLADSDSNGIKAKMDNGVLAVTIPKKIKSDNSTKIEIE